ncbi:MAG: CDP-diacylglycerol--glycerol-3-phosphate 3-phosphatidyltransferase [Caldicoprobacter sp.]|uniref:CDP-diacylglycerol--glycerol-3-phosphate 3-phosphatidyltransferase n=1 Tax=Caldicoprobacter sp. TaxID=2004500 RepID=UPI001DD2D9D8|nr:CDP-diacylglycerol--glycerol-3-phosphate 3-phosphatidyltransferase [Clostridia bacterium]
MNLANKITIVRIMLVPIFMVLLLSDFPYSNVIAALIFIVAASTDTVDGYIARKRNEVTNFGKFIDPLADKILVTAALVILVEMGKISSVVAIIIITREFIITGFRVLAASEGIVIAASWWGKAKTITQIVAIVAVMLDNMPFKWIGFPFDRIALILAVIITIVSGIDYIYKNFDILSK